MYTLGERLKYIRKSKGFTQITLANAIGVSRGVIYNLEKNKTPPQAIVLKAICTTLGINENWLESGFGEIEIVPENGRSSSILSELYEIVKGLSEQEQLFLLDLIKAVKTHFIDIDHSD